MRDQGLTRLLTRLATAWFAVDMLSRTRKIITVGVDSMRVKFEQSPTAQLVYYRTKAFIRSTFIYDLCVSDGHVVVRGLLDFIVFAPGKLVRAAGRVFNALVDFILLFARVVYRIVIPRAISVFVLRVVPKLVRLVLVLLARVGMDTVLAEFISATLHTRMYSNRVAGAVFWVRAHGLRSPRFLVVVRRVVASSGTLAVGTASPATILDLLLFIFVSPVYAVLFGVLLP